MPLILLTSLISPLLGVHLSDNLTWNEHVSHIVKKGSKWLYAIRALKKCGLIDRQLILVYCSIIRSILEYASLAWAGLTQYLSDQIESILKRALKIIFPSLYYEDALKKSGLILLRQKREEACITFLKRSYSSSDLLRGLVPRVAHTRRYALRTGESVFVPASSRTNRLEIFAPSNTRITFKLAKWDMSYHNQLYLCVIIPRYLYVINDPPCNSAYAAKRLNKRSLLLLLLLTNFHHIPQ